MSRAPLDRSGVSDIAQLNARGNMKLRGKSSFLIVTRNIDKGDDKSKSNRRCDFSDVRTGSEGKSA